METMCLMHYVAEALHLTWFNIGDLGVRAVSLMNVSALSIQNSLARTVVIAPNFPSPRRRRRRSEVTSAGQCLYARILQFQHTITNTNTNI